MKRLLLLLVLPLLTFAAPDVSPAPTKKRILHLTFNQGYANELHKVAKEMGYSVTTWHIPSLTSKFLDGTSAGTALFNMTHERAERIWDRHRDLFESFDLICVSDTTPLARIFLQNHCSKPLLIWICSPVDYYDPQTLDGSFPDHEYFSLLSAAPRTPNVFVVGASAFALHYAERLGLDLGDTIIPPCAFNTSVRFVRKKESLYIPSGHNETVFMNLKEHLQGLGLPVYSGPHQGPQDLGGYMGIVHLPDSYGSPALFEHLAYGIVYFIPSPAFFEKLATTHNYFLNQPATLLEEQLYEASEWYKSSRENVFVYFDSWEDLVEKAKNLDYKAQKAKVLSYVSDYQKEVKSRWQALFNQVFAGAAQ
ncbi:MAG: hypothetical protein KGI80_04170 [Verrucomicrobiota bacterium]|nr:hypothetical protein [Verrucomicrobiota bacterium]